ncbi:MAG: magnesium-translocating P-type ATPase [Fusobacteriaceae bacterium]
MIKTRLDTLKEKILEFSQKNIEDIYMELDSDSHGISEEIFQKNLKKFGFNETISTKQNIVLEKLKSASLNPFNIVLISLAVISYFTDVFFAYREEASWRTVIIIIAMVFLSISIKFIQEYKSSKAEETLKNLVRNSVTVEREGIVTEQDIKYLVPGDVVHLASGDMIPGDLRIISSKDLFLSQSSFTGEAEPVEKFPYLKRENISEKNIFNKENICFLGSNVLSGTGKGIVIGTGRDTYFSFMAETLISKKERTSFEKGIDSVAELLIKFMLVMVPIVFVINGFTKGSWIEALLFSISIAVGLTPEMLPMIVTTNLAKGAVSLSRKKTIVKKLDSIQNLGAMDVFCTDKTGTLTLNKIILQTHINIMGDESDEVMTYGYFNSLYQTGLKNLMDQAIIERGENEGLGKYRDIYTKIDEIPFDFTRRKMSVIIEEINGEKEIITKGALEEMLLISKSYHLNGKIIPITEEVKSQAREIVKKIGEQGMRVIALSKKNVAKEKSDFEPADECEMTLLGFMCFLDPPKESAFLAIKALKKYGIAIKVLTGDNEFVTKKICSDVGINFKVIILGNDLENKTDEELKPVLENNSVFARLTPEQKSRIVRILRKNGHTVGFMGDGINDTSAIREADVGISVDTAVDIAKETADIILLEKNLMVLAEGVIEGRKIFGNIIKYIKMAASSNFGNVFSVLVASIFLPFLPMLPIQLLAQNFLYDISQTAIPWDNMDEEFLEKPRKWSAYDIRRFMLCIGPLSSIFDIVTFLILWYIFKANGVKYASLFQTGWFVEGLLSQVLIVHAIRTRKVPFVESCGTSPLLFMTGIIAVFTLTLPGTKLGRMIGLVELPNSYFPILAAVLFSYLVLVQMVKKYYIKKFGSWL